MEIDQLRGLIGTLSWLAKETRCDLSGHVALVQQSLPHPKIHDLLQANQIAKEALKFSNLGILVRYINPQRIRAGVVTDAAWGNALQPEITDGKKGSLQDYWEERADRWVRHHRQPRKVTFHPGICFDQGQGPDLHAISARRTTCIQLPDQRTQTITDQWHQKGDIKTIGEGNWTGTTTFYKSQSGLKHTEIHGEFEQLPELNSQGGEIIVYYDSQLTASREPVPVTIASWKSYRLKRKTVNTLSAECQSLVHGVGSLQWHRLLMLESLHNRYTTRQWEQQLTRLPFIAVVDSKSLYDVISKCTNPASHIEDKRTAIDVAILKDDFKTGGQIRWVDTRAMLTDPLTKQGAANYLRHVMQKGEWSVLEEGIALQRKLLERMQHKLDAEFFLGLCLNLKLCD